MQVGTKVILAKFNQVEIRGTIVGALFPIQNVNGDIVMVYPVELEKSDVVQGLVTRHVLAIPSSLEVVLNITAGNRLYFPVVSYGEPIATKS